MDFGPHLLLVILEGVVTAAVLALTAMGLSIVFGVMRVVNVANAEFYMVGAVLAWFIATTLGTNTALGFIAAILIAPLLVGTLAAGVDRLILRRINYDPERTIVATIGTLYILQQSTLMTFGPDPRPVEPPFNSRIALPWFEWTDTGFEFYYPWGLSITSYKLFVIAATAVILITLWLAITRSKAGLIMRATQQDSDMAQAFGISVKTVYSVFFTPTLAKIFATLLFGSAGATFATVQYSILSLLWVLVGGAGTTTGAFFGVLFMTYLIDYASGQTNAYLIVVGIVLVAVTLFLPHGIMGTLRNKYAE